MYLKYNFQTLNLLWNEDRSNCLIQISNLPSVSEKYGTHTACEFEFDSFRNFHIASNSKSTRNRLTSFLSIGWLLRSTIYAVMFQYSGLFPKLKVTPLWSLKMTVVWPNLVCGRFRIWKTAREAWGRWRLLLSEYMLWNGFLPADCHHLCVYLRMLYSVHVLIREKRKEI